MARIILPVNTLIGVQLLRLNAQIIGASQAVTRLKAIADQITNNGTAPVNLETSPESQIPAGAGAAVYTGISTIKTQLDALASLVSSIDQG